MHCGVFRIFERICRERAAGGRVLEVGAVPEDHSLLFMDSLSGAAERIGLNLKGPFTHRQVRILKGDANRMEFETGSFDTVLCNAMLEHDPHFWKTLGEIYRVAKPGALIVIGTPGFAASRCTGLQSRLAASRFMRPFGRLRIVDALLSATLTFRIHDDPGDYYRFSPQAFRQVFFAGCRDVRVESALCPPRLIGSGFKV
jgi:SAM-dependent methyltransferase